MLTVRVISSAIARTQNAYTVDNNHLTAEQSLRRWGAIRKSLRWSYHETCAVGVAKLLLDPVAHPTKFANPGSYDFMCGSRDLSKTELDGNQLLREDAPHAVVRNFIITVITTTTTTTASRVCYLILNARSHTRLLSGSPSRALIVSGPAIGHFPDKCNRQATAPDRTLGLRPSETGSLDNGARMGESKRTLVNHETASTAGSFILSRSEFDYEMIVGLRI
ncbi:DNA-directed RNA polymerase III subunit RPC2-like protein [Anopheles sinensis]|uniref:DNA-directed RNA polymerase III subunit RPC2-like protein n=1 Tax=Anopheles sinensis TaxID=74873 RepID=A0A084WRW2_ANOSI|nr:DNA-directed RNA polymerase III subunit RPC2-like protein [Anopheles sinensis]